MRVNDSNRIRQSVGVLALVCFVLQLAVAPNLALANGTINFALIFSFVIATIFGGNVGMLCGFFGGLLYDLTSTGPIGLMALLLTVSSFVLGLENRNRLTDDTQGTVVIMLVVGLIDFFLYNMTMLLVGRATSVFDILILRTLPSFLLTALAFIPFLIVFSRGTGSGPTLGASVHGRKKKRGGKYSLGHL